MAICKLEVLGTQELFIPRSQKSHLPGTEGLEDSWRVIDLQSTLEGQFGVWCRRRQQQEQQQRSAGCSSKGRYRQAGNSTTWSFLEPLHIWPQAGRCYPLQAPAGRQSFLSMPTQAPRSASFGSFWIQSNFRSRLTITVHRTLNKIIHGNNVLTTQDNGVFT